MIRSARRAPTSSNRARSSAREWKAPAAGYAIGMILFSRFSLNEAEHAEVLAQLRQRRGEEA